MLAGQLLSHLSAGLMINFRLAPAVKLSARIGRLNSRLAPVIASPTLLPI
jgi:hypothetical protein